MKILIAIAFIAAASCAVLSHTRVLSATNMAPALLFATALILVLLQLINTSDRRY